MLFSTIITRRVNRYLSTRYFINTIGRVRGFRSRPDPVIFGVKIYNALLCVFFPPILPRNIDRSNNKHFFGF